MASAIISAAALAAADNGKTGKTAVGLKWAFVRQADAASGKVLDFSTQPVIRAGDRIRIYFEQTTPGYVYIFLLGSDKELTLIHPQDFSNGGSASWKGIRAVPGTGEWLEVDNIKGVEEFSIIVSAERLTELERLTDAYLKGGGADQKAKVLDCLKSLKRTRGGNTAAAEKGVPFAGTFQTRSAEKIIGNAVVVTAEEFYSKTLRLRHE